VLVGIGRIPHCVLNKLRNRRDLGIHSEMISDAVIKLFKSGQVTNARKVWFLIIRNVMYCGVELFYSMQCHRITESSCSSFVLHFYHITFSLS